MRRSSKVGPGSKEAQWPGDHGKGSSRMSGLDMGTFIVASAFVFAVSRPGLVCASCTMPTELSALSYEANGGKFYKLYRDGDNADHFTATQTCNSVGARLAMFKTTADFDIVKGYKGNTVSDMWVGLLNQDFSLCDDLATCQPLFTWIDGDRTTTANSNHLGGWDGNGRQYCVRMHSGSGSVGDKDCSDAYSFLCQYDCDNIFTATLSSVCPDAPAGFNYYYEGRAFKTHFDESKNYIGAQETCVDEGGMLPVFSSAEDYQAARVMAGLTDTPTWVGLRVKPNNMVCNSPAICEAEEIFWHIPDEAITVMMDDALFLQFKNENWLTGPVNLDSSGSTKCVTMNFADDTPGDNHELQSRKCNQGRPFACQITCTMHTAFRYCEANPSAAGAGPVFVDKAGMMNRDDAKAACEADGMHLVTIRTQAELQALETHMGGQDSVWLGAYTGVRSWGGTDEKMFWHDAGPRFDEASYTGWVDITMGQGTGCVWLTYPGGNARFDDIPCASAVRTVCMANCGGTQPVVDCGDPPAAGVQMTRCKMENTKKFINKMWYGNRLWAAGDNTTQDATAG